MSSVAQRQKWTERVNVTTADKKHLYPAFQFSSAGDTIPHLEHVFGPLIEAGMDGWAVTAWMLGPSENLQGGTPTSWITSGQNPEPAIAEAERVAANWTR